MVFSSPIFLFLFLPLVLTGYFLLPRLWLKNVWLLLFSLVFYAWGEPVFIQLAVISTLMNYMLGRWVDHTDNPGWRKFAVGVAVALNLGLLVFFKYANFTVDNLNLLLKELGASPVIIPKILLPVGISFFTFHALSYVVDVYRRKWKAATNPGDVALYIFFFPQLIAGPILRWSAIAPQLHLRHVTVDGFAEGVRRFILGLSKKMIVANVVAVPADKIFTLPIQDLTPGLAWLGAICYMLQIYFDFSGYSDMAVGMGKMFGFSFLENFNYPYVAQSVRDFWRRWHISLSTWFRDYLYIPLGGNRVSESRNYFNLILVFFLCGFWHGASWTFAIWGLYHGVFLVLERTRFGGFVESLPRPFRHGYTLIVVMLGWVLFRAQSMEHALGFVGAMFGMKENPTESVPIARFVTHQVTFAIVAGVIFSMPAWTLLNTGWKKIIRAAPAGMRPAVANIGSTLETLLLIMLFVVSAAWLAGGTYNPFIYYRF